MTRINDVLERLKRNSFAKDSFWAVFGNGLGNFLLLLSGIIIARVLGKDLYGEYGIVKSTMILTALFATFCLGDTSTKYIADSLQNEKSHNRIKSIIRSSFNIVFFFSCALSLSLFFFAEEISVFIEAPQVATSLRFLSVIIIFRAFSTLTSGILGGFKSYKDLGVNNVISGVAMVVLCIPLTMLFSLRGALWSLLISQIILALANLKSVFKEMSGIAEGITKHCEKELICFAYPFALNEFLYSGLLWATNLLLAKYASLGELGIYTACTQWYSIILFIPNLLGNVILSYLSTTSSNPQAHASVIKRTLLVNLVSTVATLFAVLLASPFILDFYGSTFEGMRPVLYVFLLSTIFPCMTRVYQANLMSERKKWTAFSIRTFYLILQFCLNYYVLVAVNSTHSALNMGYVTLFVNFIALLLYMITYKFNFNVRKRTN